MLLMAACALFIGAALLFKGLPMVVGEVEADADMRVLRDDDGVDWPALDDAPAVAQASAEGGDSRPQGLGAAVAWVTVQGTRVDYPVMMAPADDPEYYLDHNMWGGYSPSGTPFIEAECGDPYAQALMVYGHRMGTTGTMFSSIADAWQQERFDRVGKMVWQTREGAQALTPLCAVTLKEDEADLFQRVDFADDEDFRDWLGSLLDASSARSREGAALIPSAKRAITLVTCTKVRTGQPDRTLVVFIGDEDPKGAEEQKESSRPFNPGANAVTRVSDITG